MNQELIMWLFGIIITVTAIVVGAAHSRINSLVDRIGADCSTCRSGVASMRAHFEREFGAINSNIEWIKGAIDFNGRRAGVILHSPHTPEFDRLIEDFWHDRLDDLGAEILLTKLHAIEKDPTYAPVQKLAALQMTVSVCLKHKKEMPDIPFCDHS